MNLFIAILSLLVIMVVLGSFLRSLFGDYREIDVFYNSRIDRWQARYLDSPSDPYVYGYTLKEAVDKCMERG